MSGGCTAQRDASGTLLRLMTPVIDRSAGGAIVGSIETSG